KLYRGRDLSQIGAKRAEMLQMAKNEIEAAKATMPGQAAYIATGGIIAAYVANEVQNETAQRLAALAKTPGVPIEPVIAYRSYKKFRNEQSVRPADPNDAPEPLSAYAIFGWEFFVPEDIDKNDRELLHMACELASRKDLREH